MASTIIRTTSLLATRGIALSRGASSGSRGLLTRASAGPSVARRWLSGSSSSRASSSKLQLDQAAREKANYEARVELALAYRSVQHYDLGEGVCNHLTLRAPGRNTDGDVMLVVPYAMPWAKVTASSLIGIDFKTGEKVEGEGVPLQTAVCIHCPIHEARYEKYGTTAVMHTHQPYVLALACLDEPAPFDEAMCQNSMRFAGRIAYDWQYEELAYEMDEGKRLAEALGEKDILIMGQHGLLTVGPRTCDAFDNLYYMERAAMVQILARSTRAKTRQAPPSVVKGIAEHDCYPYNAISHFQSMHHLFADEKPDYRE